MKRFLTGLSKIIFSRALIIMLIVLLQFLVLVGGAYALASKSDYLYYAMYLCGALVVMAVVNKDEPAEFKLTWAVITIILPMVGILLYAFNKSNWGMVSLKHKVDEELLVSRHLLRISPGTEKEVMKQDPDFRRFSGYMDQKCGYPTYHNTRVTYYPIGEENLEAIKEELTKAEKFIFIEYFIIAEGQVWGDILEILKEKVAEGVEVRVMYDGLCSLFKLPYHYVRKLREMGINAKLFAPVIPFFSTTQNNRDHRKILVIDGHTAFTGGVNLADEYANLKVLFGHWKDIGVKLEGRAVLSMTRMFIQNWNLYGDVEKDYEKYLIEPEEKPEEDGFVIPYGDTPTTKYEIGKTVYEDIITHANEYIHIMTPYFIVDREFLSTIKYAAFKGVDVKIIIPHIPDKKIPYYVGRTFYPELLDAGVKIYEYAPGFVHAKSVVADGKMAAIGSVNLDYRSFYHHFECGVYLYRNSSIYDMEKDFDATLSKCIMVTPDYYKKEIPRRQKLLGQSVKLFAPLL
ncbi:MAG: cardiolipin synthase [Lachnospiraceae bacterium]|nr:cardiolipin synthase [Lachnospiraceae bacterium]